MKHIHKLIALSGTYGQSSRVSPSVLERDPRNLYFSRGPRLRMSAEMIRDNALRVSGLLSEKMGGPPSIRRSPTGFGVKPDATNRSRCGQKRGSFPSRGLRDLEKGRALCKFREFRRARPFVLFPQEKPDQHPFAGVDSSQ